MRLSTAGLAPLREPGYRLLYGSSFLWWFARWMDALLASWLALLLTDSAWHVALIGFYRNLPVFLFGPMAGAVADRVDRRVLLFASQAANALASFSIAALFLAGRLEFWHLGITQLVIGLAWAVDFPTRRAIIPDLVKREHLLAVGLLDTISMNLSRTLGPMLAGTVLALIDVPTSYVILTLVYGASALPLLPVRLPRRPRLPSASPLRFLGEGLAFCQRSAVLRGVLITTFLMNAFSFPFTQLLSVFARDILHVGPFELGLLTAADGIGSIIGAVLMGASGRLRRYGRVFALCSVVMCLALTLFAASTTFALAFSLLVLAGIAHAGFSSLQIALTLRVAHEEVRGRVMGVLTLAIGSATFGMLASGALAAALGAAWAIGLTSAAGAGLIAANALLTPGLLRYEAPLVTTLPAPREPSAPPA